MATSLVHIGDFHAAPGPRNEDRFRALDQLIAQALQLPALGAWLWPGDLSHQRQAIADENALIERLRRMSAVAPVVLVYGNHDLPGDLDKFAAVGAGNPIYVVDRPQVLRIRLATMEFASIACLPYPHKQGLVMAGCANADIPAAAAEHLDAIFMQFAVELEQARAHGDLTLFIGHVNVGGAIVSSGQPNIGREIELSPRHLDRLGDVYKGLNHVHKAQEIYGAHYAGSICRLDWGEIEEKRFLQIEYDGGPSSSLGYQHVTSHWLDVPPMYWVAGVAAQMRGYLGKRLGFNFFANQNTPTLTSATVADVAGAINNGAGYAAGIKSIAIDGMTTAGVFKAGDMVTRVASRAGVHKASAQYTVSGQVDEGVILQGAATKTADWDTEGADSVDHGASTANGGAGFQQIGAFSGFTGFVGKIRHSADDITYADLVTFANVTAARNGQRVAVAGTIDRHLAYKGDVTDTGSIGILLAGFARG